MSDIVIGCGVRCDDVYVANGISLNKNRKISLLKNSAIVRTYYPDLQAIEQQTKQLENESCQHCHRERQLISHGFIYKKRVGAEPQAIGKRVFCSNRDHH